MDFRIFYVILGTVIASYAEPCSVILGNFCTYTVSCTNQVDGNLDWTRFSQRHNTVYNDGTCHQSIVFNGYRVYPVKLVYKQTYKEIDASAIPKMSNSWGNGNFLSVVQELDLSEDEYNETPIIKSMQNLLKLNMSNNQLTTAMLSNGIELGALIEIDLSHNRISDIQVKNYEYPYKRLTKIDISNNYLVTIPDAIFDDFDSLETIDLSYNYINTLSQFTFEGIKKLKELNLSYNRLRGINSSLFRFIELKVLKLAGNRIKEVKLNDFEQLRKLETLDLSSNIIQTINFDAFNTMILLENLYLGNNQLEVISKNSFSSLQSLSSIDLSRNKLKSLPKDIFINNTILTFSIEENRLEGSLERGMFEGVNVTKLDLSKQFLSEVRDNAFNDLIRLDTLLLNTNKIQVLTKMCFKTLINLQKLDLSNNQLTNIDFNKDDLGNLHSLLMKNNHLTAINYLQFQPLSDLEFLDLSDNQISSLEPKSFQSLKKLINLGISSNPLIGTLETGTFDGLLLLPSLDISRTKLTTIQNASFNDMNQLKDLNMSGCEISELQYNTFVNTGYIETLDLSYNRLKEFAVNTSELVAISTLLLNNNFIKSISSSSLHGLLRLNKIILSHNVIENIDKASFTSLIDIRYLDLSYNKKLNFTVSILDKTKNLNTLILSGVKTAINFAAIIDDSPITDLRLANSNIQNISELNLGKIVHLDSLDLSYNNVSKLQIGDFTGISTLRSLDLSFNQITSIQPGVFKENTALNSLNISHNILPAIGYGIFRGLIYLSILDISYNNIRDLQSERFYEVKSLTQLIADFNKIDSINAEEFEGTTLSKLSIGDNPLPCQILVKLKKNGVPFEITAIRIDEHSNENVNGVTCNRDHQSESTISDRVNDHSDVLSGLRNILQNFTNRDSERVNAEYLGNILNILEKSYSIYDDKLSDLANLTGKVIAVNNNTNILISKIMASLPQNSAVTVNSTPLPPTATVTQATTFVPVLGNNSSVNQTIDIIPYVNKIRNDLENAIKNQKQDIMDEIESKFATNNYRTNALSTSIGHERLVSNGEESKSFFTEICVGLILIILVGLVLYKFYKSRMFIRNRFSYSTRELPGAMENSAL